MVNGWFSVVIRAAARRDAARHVVDLADTGVAIAVTPWPGFSLRVLSARDGDAVSTGDALVVADVYDIGDDVSFAVTFGGQLALRTGIARHEGEPDPEVLASARAFVTTLSNAAGAPNARELLAALSGLDGDRRLGEELYEDLFAGVV